MTETAIRIIDFKMSNVTLRRELVVEINIGKYSIEDSQNLLQFSNPCYVHMF